MNDRARFSVDAIAEPSLTPPNRAPWQGSGQVCAVDGAQSIVVQVDGACFTARVAASCLLLPQPGDTVWCCGEAAAQGVPGRQWITSVLERGGCGPAQVQLPASARLTSADARLSIETDELTLRTTRATVLFDTATAVGGCWEAIVGAMQFTGTTLRSVFDRVTQVAKHRQQFTEGTDTVQAGVLDLRGDSLATVNAEHVLVQGERLVKTRAAQIHMG
jgi:hypothetical protein